MAPSALRSRFVRRLRRWGVGALAAAYLCLAAIDALPQSPPALREALKPITERLGLTQPWYVFAPQPDSVNTRVRAEIAYADGERAVWRSPNWPELSRWERWTGHRRAAWVNNMWGQEDAVAWPAWARHVARSQRAGDPQADRGAEVKFVVSESRVRAAEIKPWKSCRVPPPLDEEWVMTNEKLP
jgi:hypothetical protein